MNADTSRDNPGDSPMLAPLTSTHNWPIAKSIMDLEQSIRESLLANGFIITAEVMDSIVAEPAKPKNDDYSAIESRVPNAFITGLGYYASRGGPDLTEEQLANIPVGMQEHAIEPGSITLRAESLSASIHRLEPMDSSIFGDVSNVDKEESDAVKTAKKIHKQSAKAVAYDAQKARVSRRLLLANRSKQLTVVCPVTGIVSLIDVPNIPYPSSNQALAKALIWSSPFADLANCRGIAQQGISYLRKLDTQVLAGVLIVLADAYELFKFQPFDSGSQKNAILRTAGKDYIIDAIIMIENQIHSGNCKFLPTLSLRFDSNLEAFGLEVRMQSYLKILADAIAKPDKEAWDEKKILPMYPIRPTYTKDIKSGQQKVSFLARQEQARAKKEFAEDKKAGKLAISQLCKQASVTDKLKSLLNSLMADEGMLLIPPVFIDKVIEKLEFSYLTNENAKQLVAILKKDRRALKLDLAELEANIEEALESEEDEPAPGNEAAIEAEGPALALTPSIEDSSTDDEDSSNEDSNDDEPSDFQDTEGDAYVADMIAEEKQEIEDQQALKAPAGLTAWEKILWRKKMSASIQRKAVQNTSIPSTAIYVPGDKKAKLGDKE